MSKPLVSLRPVTRENLYPILDLKVLEPQNAFVASNAISLAEAHFSETAWYRAIYADDVPVGFLMLDTQLKDGCPYLWRLMVDHRFQGQGYGQAAMHLLIEHIRTEMRSRGLLTSVVPKPGGPQPFYEKLGFELTGDMDDGEAVMLLVLPPG